MPMTEQALRDLLDLLDELHDGTNSRKVADATLIVRRAVRARLSRVTRQPRIPSSPLYYPDASVDPAQLDFVTGQTPTAVDNSVGTVEDPVVEALRWARDTVEPQAKFRPARDLLQALDLLNWGEVTTDGEADEEGREGEALLTD